jgi:hypothetical protein
MIYSPKDSQDDAKWSLAILQTSSLLGIILPKLQISSHLAFLFG